jgi:cardiolipin synthase
VKLLLFLVAVLWLFITGAATGHVLLNKRKPRGAALWLVIIALVPLAGPLFYWVLGINRLKRKSAFRARMKAVYGDKFQHLSSAAALPPSFPDGVVSLAGISERVSGQPLTAGNRIDPLYEGNQAFPAMLTAIGAARHSVNLSTYILDRDAVGLRIVSTLCAAAGRGVKVRVLVDGIGTSRSAILMARRLRGAGASLSIFHPLLGLTMRRPSINLRNHRKILIVDGKVGFTGGLNITGRHFLSRWKQDPPVRDIHFRVEGPVLSSMQMVFAQDWQTSRGEVLEGETFFPEPTQKGDVLARMIASGPDEDLENIYEIILGALRSARRSVLIMTPYFIPDRAIIQALRSTVLAGVSVDLLLPEKSDHPLVQSASTAYLPELLEAGVRIVLVPPPFVHSKLMVVDNIWSLIGSANLDPRSFRLNFELDLEVYSANLAEELEGYARDMSVDGSILTQEMLESRPLRMRLLEGAVKVFSPYL